MEQRDLDAAVKIATRAAMNGNPVRRIVYVPPQTATQSSNWIIDYCDKCLTAADTPPWEQ